MRFSGIKIRLKAAAVCLSEKLFSFLYRVMPQDRIVVYDSNGASFSKETFLKQDILRGKTSLVIPDRTIKNWLKLLLTVSRAKVFVPNTNTKYTRMLKDAGGNKTTVVNIWHGAGYFKKFGKDEDDIGVQEYRRRYGKPDYVISSSEEIQAKIADVFTIETERVLPLGTARSDLLFDRKYRRNSEKAFYSEYPHLKDKKIYLFAPTWRGVPLDSSTAYFHPELNFKEVSRLLHDDEVIVVKNHQCVIKNGHNCNIQYYDNVISCDHEAIMMLLIVCDVLITDYSSVFYDGMMIDKPILFYAEDVPEYTAVNQLYEDYENFCPGEMLTQPDPVAFVEMIRHSGDYVKTEKYQSLKKKFVGSCDGRSSERLAKFLDSLMCSG